MPFLLGAVPLIASALGTTLPTALAIGLPAAAGAFGMASGIAREDPFAAIMGAAEGALGGLGGAGALGSGLSGASAGSQAGQAAQAAAQGAQAAAQGSTTAAPILGAAETAASAIAPTAQIGETVARAPTALMDSINAGLNTTIDASKPLEAVAPLTWGGESPQSLFLPGGSAIPQNLGAPTKSMGLADSISAGLQGASAATQGVMGLIDAFRDKKGGSGVSLQGVDNYLPAMPFGQLGNLPQSPQADGGVTKTPFNLELPGNELFYQLMNSFVG